MTGFEPVSRSFANWRPEPLDDIDARCPNMHSYVSELGWHHWPERVFRKLPNNPKGIPLSLRVAVLVAAIGKLHNKASRCCENVFSLLDGVFVGWMHSGIPPRVFDGIERGIERIEN